MVGPFSRLLILFLDDFRLFCGDLGNEVNDDMLKKAFGKYPSLAKTRVVRDHRTHKSKGYGFVSFTHGSDYARAFREMDGSSMFAALGC